MTRPRTDFLFARPSFASGVARLLDVGNSLNIYNESENGETADRKAIRNDFEMIGQDFSNAFQKITGNLKLQKK